MRKLWLIPVGFLLMTLVVYGQSLRNDFINLDDKPLILENPIVRGLSVENMRKAFTSYDPELYIPLTLLSYQAEYDIAGLNPALVHLDNLLLHTLSSLLVAWIIFLLLKNTWFAVFCGLLFAVHPQNAEAVLWASARKDLLSGFFCFASIATYLPATKQGNVGRRWKTLSITLFALGLLSKVSIVFLPLALLLIDWQRLGTLTQRNIIDKIPYAMLSFVFIIIAFIGKSAAIAHTTIMQKALMAPKTILFTLTQFLLPHDLSLLYPYSKTISVMDPGIFMPIVALVLLGLLVFINRRATKMIATGIGIFLVMLVPSLPNIERGTDLYVASDRYAYVPSIGLLLIMAYLLRLLREKITQKQKTALTLTGLLLITTFGFQTNRRSLTWRNNRTLYASVLSLYPNSYVAHSNLGLDALERSEFETAASEFRLARGIHDTTDMKINEAIALNNLGARLINEKKWQQAIEVLSEAAVLNPIVSDIYFNLGVCFEQMGKRKEARSAFLEAVRLNPKDTEALQKLNRLK
ncbi:tetratricopeptide repeat protein [Candidatus Peribacteria bacterium]|nr:tetratricopeptide repeat protein [Candidatus Peribacteria bacterium]